MLPPKPLEPAYKVPSYDSIRASILCSLVGILFVFVQLNEFLLLNMKELFAFLYEAVTDLLPFDRTNSLCNVLLVNEELNSGFNHIDIVKFARVSVNDVFI